MGASTALRRVVAGFAIFAFIVAIAWVGYLSFGCRPLDALYMVVVTVFGIGYGEFCPVTDSARWFTMFVIVTGTGSVLFTFGGFIQLMTEGELHRALDQRRKTRDIAGLHDHVVICGFNHIGQVLARQLQLAERPFVVVEERSQALTLAEEAGYRVCQGLATDEQTLLLARVDHARALATVLPDDADNLFITLTARGLNRELVILARGDVPSTEKKLRQAGADHVVLPATISGMQMANLITQPTAVDYLAQNTERQRLNEMLSHLELQMDELTISEGSALDGLTIAEIEVKGKGIFMVIALRHADGTTVTRPDSSEILRGGDALIVLGHAGDMPQFTRRYDVSHSSRYRAGARG
ncbi:potassium channel family protein [Methylotetracoccus oryzae]|uniref:potassium channel family protein n=1 Tax=Methylotetracoccus oryzae TaxID=1919059 RepID=UPI00111B452A|nr:potassium channel protein [Methylotetracoccus oryzae]